DQAVTASAVSKQIIDLTPVHGAFRDIGIGEPLELFAQVTEQANAAGEATVQIKLETATDDKFSDAKSIFESVAIP
ncbi:hypothetical protein QMO39_32535, partial [Pseudomonas aeruginosa]|uniref:Bbp16 family capsid cement protein n=1 Tax=Pseudomonas aeruginosa TaxID=287 RepID=UPI003014B0FD|nr:hypothetical protein [Pseudomonas aeruginosa]